MVSTFKEVNWLKILIDSAQSFGSLNDGRNVGNMGHAATTSFFPAKPLGCYGDGGAIFIKDNELADIVRSIRLHGKGLEKYDHVRVGLNSRLDTLQAAILLEKLKLFPKEIENRNKLASAYRENIKLPIEHQFINEKFQSVWAQYTIKSKDRNKLKSALSQKKVPTAIYYPKPLHLQDGFNHFPVVDGGCKISSNLSEDVISLPMHPYLSDNEIEILIDTINSIVV